MKKWRRNSYLLITFSSRSFHSYTQKFPPNFELVKKSYLDRFFLLFTLCMFFVGQLGGWVRFSTRITNSNFYSLTRPLLQYILLLIREKRQNFPFSVLFCWFRTKRKTLWYFVPWENEIKKSLKICLQFSKWKFSLHKPPPSFSHYLN